MDLIRISESFNGFLTIEEKKRRNKPPGSERRAHRGQQEGFTTDNSALTEL